MQKISQMAVTRLERKARRNKTRAKVRVKTIKRNMGRVFVKSPYKEGSGVILEVDDVFKTVEEHNKSSKAAAKKEAVAEKETAVESAAKVEVAAETETTDKPAAKKETAKKVKKETVEGIADSTTKAKKSKPKSDTAEG